MASKTVRRDGASVKTDFADSSVLKNWIDSKKRRGVV